MRSNEGVMKSEEGVMRSDAGVIGLMRSDEA